MYPLILGLTRLDVFSKQNARANTIGSTIGVRYGPCQYLESDFFRTIATVVCLLCLGFVSDKSGVTID
jgi:hypothetical protein